MFDMSASSYNEEYKTRWVQYIIEFRETDFQPHTATQAAGKRRL
jgi:hypothetical protein